GVEFPQLEVGGDETWLEFECSQVRALRPRQVALDAVNLAPEHVHFAGARRQRDLLLEPRQRGLGLFLPQRDRDELCHRLGVPRRQAQRGFELAPRVATVALRQQGDSDEIGSAWVPWRQLD